MQLRGAYAELHRGRYENDGIKSRFQGLHASIVGVLFAFQLATLTVFSTRVRHTPKIFLPFATHYHWPEISHTKKQVRIDAHVLLQLA